MWTTCKLTLILERYTPCPRQQLVKTLPCTLLFHSSPTALGQNWRILPSHNSAHRQKTFAQFAGFGSFTWPLHVFIYLTWSFLVLSRGKSLGLFLFDGKEKLNVGILRTPSLWFLTVLRSSSEDDDKNPSSSRSARSSWVQNGDKWRLFSLLDRTAGAGFCVRNILSPESLSRHTWTH